MVDMNVQMQARPEASPENLARLVKQVANPQARLSVVVESALRQVVAGATMDDLMSDRRQALFEKAQSLAQDQLKAEGMPLADLILSVERVQAPWPVLDSWRDSARALREADRILIESQTNQELLVTETNAGVARLVADARTDAENLIVDAKSQADSFRALVKARIGHPNLSDHRRFWSDLAELLKDRPKVLLDSPSGDIYGTNAPKRHLILPESPLTFGFAGGSQAADSITKPASDPITGPSAPISGTNP